MASKGKLVSIIAPFYNESETVDSFYQALRGPLAEVPDIRFEVICVDDGSSDETLRRLIGLIDRDARYSVIELSRHFGKEAALTAGLDAAKGDAVIPMLEENAAMKKYMIACLFITGLASPALAEETRYFLVYDTVGLCSVLEGQPSAGQMAFGSAEGYSTEKDAKNALETARNDPEKCKGVVE